MKNTWLLFLSLILLFPNLFQAQDIEYAKSIISELTSHQLYGRGYYLEGDRKAAMLINREFSDMNLRKFEYTYFQDFSFGINIITDVKLKVDRELLQPGSEYLVSSSSPPISGTFPLHFDLEPVDESGDTTLLNPPSPDYFVVTGLDYRSLEKQFPYQATGVIALRDPEENMWWHVSNAVQVSDSPILVVRSDKISENSQSITVKVKSAYNYDYLTHNMIGYIKGSSEPDSFLVFTAHYDHLGQMGRKTCFFGANDNASGTAMVLDLAKYYAQTENQHPYSMVFVLFSGEEAGLKGSKYLAENPLFPLEKIRMLINLDMVGTGSEGITVVNGKILNNEFSLLEKINDEKKYLAEVKERDESCNSDHCPFYLKGVPSIFIYTRGKEYTEYHNIKDRAEDLPLTEYDDLFRLILDFANELPECPPSM